MNSMRMRKFFDSASVITISVNFMALDLSHPERPREGWPLLLTAESEANGDSRSTYERGPSLVGLLGSLFTVGTRDFCPAMAALVGLG